MSAPTEADIREAEQWLREHRWLRGNSATRQRNAAQLALLLARIREEGRKEGIAEPCSWCMNEGEEKRNG